MKSWNDILLRNASFFQREANPIFCPITLNPYFRVDDVNMKEIVVDSSSVTLPADNYDQMTIIHFVENGYVDGIPALVAASSEWQQ